MSDTQRRSCVSCVNYVPADAVPNTFGKGINAGLCKAKMEVVELPTNSKQSNSKLARDKAKDCKFYDKLQLSANNELINIGFPEKHIGAADRTFESKPKTCRTCEFFVHEDEVIRNTTIAAPGCAARGKLMFPDRLVAIASKCDKGVEAGWSHEAPEFVGSIRLLPDIERALAPDEAEKVGDPLEYDTDADVTDEDRQKGIRAWREVSNAQGTRSIMLPIFDRDIFPWEEQILIPRPGDDERPELYLDHGGLVYTVAVMWLKLEQTPALWGLPGTGKTELLRHMAFLMQVPFYRINITDSTEVDELLGKMTYVKETGTVFQYGTLPKRWQKLGVLCIDEPNVGPPDVWQVLRPLTDNSKQLVVTQNEGELIKRHDFCFLGLAMNPAWHPLNVGTRELGAADVSRILHLTLDLPSEELERRIITERVASYGEKLSKEDLNTIMAIAGDIRRMSADSEIPITWGIREQIKVARLWSHFDIEQVYELAIADFLEPDQKTTLISGAVSSHVVRRK